MLSNSLTEALPVGSSPPLSSPSTRTSASGAAAATPAPSSTSTDATTQADAAPVDSASLKKSVDTINHFLQPHTGNIEFSIDDQSGKTLLKIVDTETNTVLMQIPSKEALALSQTVGQTKGFLIKDSA